MKIKLHNFKLLNRLREPETAEQKIKKIVRQFYPVMTKPVKYASLFYTYYYLLDVEEIKGLRKDFEIVRNKLWTAFYNYGVYSAGEEMKFLVDFAAAERMSEKEIYKDISSHIRDTHFSRYDIDAAVLLIQKYIKIPSFPPEEHRFIEEFCLWMEKEMHAFSRSRDFLRTNLLLFDTLAAGSAWSKICTLLLNRDKTTPTIFVDSCWSIQHNTGVWLDLIAPKGEIETLKKILDWNLVGQMDEIFKYALLYDKNLIRYRESFKK